MHVAPTPSRRFCMRCRSLLCLIALAAAGCQPVVTRFEVLSFKNELQQDRFTEQFPPGSFSITAHRDFTITFELRPEVNIEPTTSAPSDDASQLVRIEVFWKPRPGTTFAESSQTNANLSYCLISGRHAVTYEGAGFVYFTRSSDGKTLTGKIESGTLVPVHFAGEPNDLFGRCHLKGTFIAHEDRRKVVAAEHKLEHFKGRALPNP